MENTPTENQVYTSPSERIKNIILNKLEECERYFSNGEKEKFINSTKSLKRLSFMQIQKADKESIKKADESEVKEIDLKHKDYKLNPEEKRKAIKDIQERCAANRLELLIEALSRSPVVEKDVEVDFQISEKMEVLRELVKQPIEEGDNSGRFV